jgi:hypothetical protein
VHVRVPSGHVHLMTYPPPVLPESVRARGGRGGCAVHGREARAVEAGLVRRRGRVVEMGRGLLGMASWAPRGTFQVRLGYPSYVLTKVTIVSAMRRDLPITFVKRISRERERSRNALMMTYRVDEQLRCQ